MEMKEVLNLAAFYLSLENALEDEATREKLLKCANLVRAEIASDYVPLIAREKLSSDDGILAPSGLSRRLIDVKRITRKGKPVRFKAGSGVIETVPGEIEVEYSYMPEDAASGDDTGFPDKVSARAIACGTAAEYCLVTGLFEEAALWEKRFKDSLLAAQRKNSEIRVKARRWE